MTEKPIYQRPYVGDLSGMSAIGGKVKPLAMCISGHIVSQEGCRTGTYPTSTGGSCSPTGLGETYGYCRNGNLDVSGCKSGTTHTG